MLTANGEWFIENQIMLDGMLARHTCGVTFVADTASDLQVKMDDHEEWHTMSDNRNQPTISDAVAGLIHRGEFDVLSQLLNALDGIKATDNSEIEVIPQDAESQSAIDDIEHLINGDSFYSDGTIVRLNPDLDTLRATLASETVTINRGVLDSLFDTLGTLMIAIQNDKITYQDTDILRDSLDNLRPLTSYMVPQYLTAFQRQYRLTDAEMERVINQ